MQVHRTPDERQLDSGHKHALIKQSAFLHEAQPLWMSDDLHYECIEPSKHKRQKGSAKTVNSRVPHIIQELLQHTGFFVAMFTCLQGNSVWPIRKKKKKTNTLFKPNEALNSTKAGEIVLFNYSYRAFG